MQLREDRLTAAADPKYTSRTTQLNSKLTAAATSHLPPPWKLKGAHTRQCPSISINFFLSFVIMFRQDKISLFLCTIVRRQVQTHKKLRDSHTNINLNQLQETIALFPGGKTKSNNSHLHTSPVAKLFYYKCDSNFTLLTAYSVIFTIQQSRGESDYLPSLQTGLKKCRNGNIQLLLSTTRKQWI